MDVTDFAVSVLLRMSNSSVIFAMSLCCRYPHLPCLQVGQEQKHTYLPLEVRCFSLLGRLRRVDLIKWVSDFRPSTKSFSDSDEIWYVGRGR